MSVLAYPIADLIERLRAIPEIRLIGIGPDLVAATTQPPTAQPALFVSSSTRGGKQLFTGPEIEQERSTRVHLVLWVRHARGAAATVAERDALFGAIEARLAGWSPSDDFGELELESATDRLTLVDWLVFEAIYKSDWTMITTRQP